MKSFYRLFTFLILLFFSIVGNGQSNDAIIKDIRSSFSAINNDKSLKVIKLINDDFKHQTTDGGESLIGYFKGDTLCKIQVSVGLSFGVREFEYYLKNGHPFFIYEKEEDFPVDNSGMLNYKKLDLAFEGRYYLYGGKVINTKVTGKKRFGERPDIWTKDIKVYTKFLLAHFKK